MRGDHGGENVDVATYMVGIKLGNIANCGVQRSTWNSRIE
jgi:hypothetical protein